MAKTSLYVLKACGILVLLLSALPFLGLMFLFDAPSSSESAFLKMWIASAIPALATSFSAAAVSGRADENQALRRWMIFAIGAGPFIVLTIVMNTYCGGKLTCA